MNTSEQPAGVAAPYDPFAEKAEKTAEERKQQLAQRVAQEVQRGKGHVESQSDFQATLVRGHRPNHLLHLILSVFTLGLWLVVWIAVAVFGGEKRLMVSVDGYGNTLSRTL